MNEKKKKLLSRIRKLDDWQKFMLVFDFLYDANEKQLQRIENEVDNYERINKEDEEKYAKK